MEGVTQRRRGVAEKEESELAEARDGRPPKKLDGFIL
jgi:hypothetical protein